MSENKYTITPAPWNGKSWISGANGELVCKVAGTNSRHRDTANARLIAAAPELLEALRKCKQAVENVNLPPSARLELVRDYSTPILSKATSL